MHINCRLNQSLVFVHLILDLLFQLLVREAGTLAQLCEQTHAFWPLKSANHLAVFILVKALSEALSRGMREVVEHSHQVLHVEQVLRDGAVVCQLAQSQDGVPNAAVCHQSRHDRLLCDAQHVFFVCVFQQSSTDSVVHLPQSLLEDLLLIRIIRRRQLKSLNQAEKLGHQRYVSAGILKDGLALHFGSQELHINHDLVGV